MIVSIYHKGLKRFWTKKDASGLPADQIKKIKFILDLLDSAELISDMNFPGKPTGVSYFDLKKVMRTWLTI